MAGEIKSGNGSGGTALRSQSAGTAQERETEYVPPADILENEAGFVLLLDIPGVQERDVNIDVEKNVLTVSAAVKPTSPAHSESMDGYELRYSEYGEGNYKRRFRLANGFDLGKVDASISNGVLRVFLPKAAEVMPKKIQVRAA